MRKTVLIFDFHVILIYQIIAPLFNFAKMHRKVGGGLGANPL